MDRSRAIVVMTMETDGARGHQRLRSAQELEYESWLSKNLVTNHAPRRTSGVEHSCN